MDIKIALAGNPNCGKTTLFNDLTGSNQYVGNWPGVTVEKKEGRLKGRKDVVIQDLPGIYSLSPYTLEEVVARNYLVKEKPDAILNIVDGTNIERNLYLTTQLIELGLPVVVAVNMMDLVRKNGDQIDAKKLSDALGCQVVEISALKGEGGAAWFNGPSMRNWGMEFLVGYRSTLPCGLGIDVSANADFFRNKVTWLPEQAKGSYAHTPEEDLVESGMPYGSMAGYVVEGIFQTQAEVDASGQPNARLGGLKYADLNNSGTIDSNDQDWIYNPVPKFSYGINIGLNYKGFDLSMFWQGVCGQDVYNNQKAQTDFWAITDAGQNKGSRLLDAWNTNNTGSDIPRLSTRNSADEGRMSSYYVENGSYIKLRSLQLGYTLPKEVASKLLMTSARVYVSGQNLLTVKSQSLTCPDPENPNWNYPIATSVSFGLQLSF